MNSRNNKGVTGRGRKTSRALLASAVTGAGWLAAGPQMLAVVVVAGAGWMAATPRAEAVTWQAASTAANVNWDTAANWNGGVPNTTASVVLFNSTALGPYPNILSDNTAVTTIASLTWSTNTTNRAQTYNTTLNAPLVIANTAAIDVLFADGSVNEGLPTANISGTSSLTVNDPSGNIRVNGDGTGSGAGGGATLNLADLSSFIATVNFVGVGALASGANTPQVNSTLFNLPTGINNGPGTASISTNTFDVFGGGRSATSATVNLGHSLNLNVDQFTLGANVDASNPATVQFNSVLGAAGGSLTMVGNSGPGANLTIGQLGGGAATLNLTTNATANTTNTSATNTSGIGLSLTLNNLIVGQGTSAAIFNFAATTDTGSTLTANTINVDSGTGGSTGAFTINGGKVSSAGAVNIATGTSGTGTITVNNLGQFNVTAGGVNIGSATSTGTFTLNNTVTSTVVGGLNLGGAAGTTTNTVNVNNGSSLNVDAIAFNGGTGNVNIGGTAGVMTVGSAGIVVNGGTANVAVSGTGTLNMSGASIASVTAPLTKFTLSGGTVSNVANLFTQTYTGGTGTASLAINSGGKLQISASGAVNATGTTLTLGTNATMDVHTNVNNTPTTDTFTFKGLTVSGGDTFDFDLGIGAVDNIVVTGASTLSLAGMNTINFTQLAASPVVPGVFSLISFAGGPYVGTPGGDSTQFFTSNASSFNSANYGYQLIDTGTSLALQITALVGWTGANSATDNNWSDAANWSTPVPSNPGDTASLLPPGAAPNGSSFFAINLDVNETVGTLTIDGTTSYTLSSNDGSALTFQQPTATVAYLNVLKAAHTINVPLILNNDVDVTILSPGSLTLGAAVTTSGTGSFIVLGGGTVTLASGAGLAFQNTTVALNTGKLDTNGNTGVILGGLAGNSINGSIDFRGTTVEVGNNNLNTSFAGSMISTGGGGVLEKIGSGTLTLTGSSSITGGVLLSAGVLNVNSENAMGSTAGALTFIGNSTLQAGANNLNLTRSIVINSAVVGSIDTQANSVTASGIISGSGTLQKLGTGTLTLTKTNTYSGGTTLTAGTLSITSLANIGSPTGTQLVFNGGLLGLPNPFTGIDINNLPTDYTNFNGGFNIALNTANTLIFSHNLSGTGNFIKAGTSVLTISGSNTYTGSTEVQGGTLALGSVNGFGAGPLNVSTGAIADLHGFSATVGGLTGSGGSITSTVAGTPVTLTVNTLNNPNLAVYSGIISDPSGSSLSFVKTGAGTTILGISNTYTGGTSITGGTLSLADNTTGGAHWLGTGAVTLSGGGALRLAGNGSNTGNTYDQFSNPIVVADTGSIFAGVRSNLASVVTGPVTATLNYQADYVRGTISGDWSGFLGTVNVTGQGNAAGDEFRFATGANLINANVILNAPASITTGTAGTYNLGALSGNGTLGGGNSGVAGTWSIGALGTSTEFDGVITTLAIITKVGGGTLTLTGANLYTGVTTITGGAIQIGNPTVNGGVTGTLGTAGVTNNASLIFNRSDTTPDAFVVSNVISGSGSVTQAGTGVTSLTGSNTYTGGTTINAGKLSLENTAGSATGTGAVTVNNTGALGGTGSTTSAVTVASGGIITPGTFGVGTLTVGSLTLNSGSILNYEFQGFAQPNDLTVVTAANGLTINGAGLNLFQPSTTSPYSATGFYTLMTYNGTLGGVGAAGLSVLNADPTKSYIFSSAGGLVSLLITDGGTNTNFWKSDSDSNWNNTANWTTGAVPQNANDFAGFGVGGSTTGPRIVTLDINATVGTLSFDSANAANTFTITGTNTLTLDAGANAAVVDDLNGSHVVQVPVAMNSSTVFNVQNAGDVLTMSGVISDGFVSSVVKSGLGTLVFSGANTYSTSSNVVAAGTLQLTGAGTLGQPSNSLQMNFGTLDLTTTTQTVGTVTISGGDIINGTLVSNSINFTGSGTSTISSSLANPTSVTVGSLTPGAPAGKLILSGANTYSNLTTINSGTLQISAANNLGDGSANNYILMNGGTLESSGNTYDLGVNRQVIVGLPAKIQTDAGTLTISGPVINSALLTILGAGNTSITGSLEGGAGVTIQGAGNNSISGSIFGGQVTVQGSGNNTISGPISGGNGVTMSGTGSLTLSGANSYGGVTALTAGTLSVSNVSDDGTGNIGVDLATGALALSSGSTFTYTGAVALPSTTTARGVTLNGGAIINVVSGTLNFTGAVVGNAAAFTKTGPGTLVLGDDNPTTPDVVDANLEVNVQQGTLILDHNNAAEGNTSTTVDAITDIAAGALVQIGNLSGNQIYDGNATRGVTINGGGTLDLNGASEIISFLAGTNGIVTDSAASTTSLLTVGLTNPTGNTYSGVLQNGAGKLALAKVGTGTQTISGLLNTYTGGTTVSAGTLIFGVPAAFPAGTALTIAAAGKAQVAPTITRGTVLRVGTLSIAGATTGGAIAPTGALDLTNNDAIISGGYTPAEIGQLIKAGLPGLATSFGIVSTSHTASTGLGYATAAEYQLVHGASATFDGVTLGTNDVVVKYTYLGDANLDGKISVADYARIDSSFLLGISTGLDWFDGDFNYDGVINFADYALIDAAYVAQSGVLAEGEIDAHTAEFGAPYLAALAADMNPAPVPEPASVGLLAVGAVGLLKRRRR